MKKSQYLKEGLGEISTLLGVHSIASKQTTKQLKRERKQTEKFKEGVLEELKHIKSEVVSARQKEFELRTAVLPLQLAIERASKGLSEDEGVNIEKLTPAEVKKILDEALEAWKKEGDPSKNESCSCPPIMAFEFMTNFDKPCH